MTETPPTTLALLSRLVPQSGPGVDPVTLLALLHEAGVDVDLERLARILAYLVEHEMAVEERGRYKQARGVKW